MKKLLSLLLAMTLVVSCFAVVPVMAEETFPEISLSTDAITVVSGYKVKVSATTAAEGGKINYYCNGALVVGNSADMEAYVPANTGVNTVYAELVDDDGAVLATSEPITFNAYTDIFEPALHRDGSTSTFARHNKHVPTSTEYKDFGVIGYEDDSNTFASDATHQNALKLSSGLAGEFGNSINVLTYYAGRKPNASSMANAGRLYTQSIDIYPENITANDFTIRAYYPSSKTRENVVINAFKFGADNMSIATNRGGTAFVTVPYEQDNWYTAKMIFDPMAGKIMLAVNDVIYSIIDASATTDAPIALNNGLADNYLYFDVILYGSNAEDANVVYLDNHDFTCSYLPEISLSTDATTVVNGSKVKVSATTNVEGKKFNYYCNDVLVAGNSASAEAYVPAKLGVNTVYAELVNDNGAVLATSDPVTINAYVDSFETALHRDGSTSTFAKHNKHVPTSSEYKDYGVIGYEDDTTTFASDATHQKVLKLSSGLAGEFGNSINVITYYAGRKPNASSMANASRLYTQSLDIYPENITKGALSLRLYYPSKKSRETAIADAFKFGVDTLTVAANRAGTQYVTVPYTQDKWYNVKAIFDPIAGKIMLAVDDVIYSVIDESATEYTPIALNNELADNYLYFDITLGGSGAEDANVVYLDNNDFTYSVSPEISISTDTTKVLSGYKVKVSATANVEGGKINYYCNGVLAVANSAAKEAYVTAQAGENTAYAELVDDSGSVLATSDTITFNAYGDEFVDVYKQSGSTSVFGMHSKHSNGANGKYNKEEIPNPYGTSEFVNDTTKFASDADHGSVLKISSAEANTAEAPLLNILSKYRVHTGLANSTRMYSISIDVYPESIVAQSFSFANALATKAAADKYFYFFKFDKDYLYVSVNGSNFTDAIAIPLEKKWYTLEVIGDPVSGCYIAAVNDVIYSVVDKSGTNDAPKVMDGSSMIYYDMTLQGSKDAENPNVIYLDNYVVSYSTLPTHSAVKYTNGAKVVTNRSEISSESNLVINFTANKGEFANVLCIATVLENNGELVCLDTQDVTFTEGVDSANVELTLTNLPASIATGGYTVNVMLWDKVTNEPIVTKIVLPN